MVEVEVAKGGHFGGGVGLAHAPAAHIVPRNRRECTHDGKASVGAVAHHNTKRTPWQGYNV